MKKTLRPSAGHILDIDSLEIADQFLTAARNVNTRKGFPSRIGGRRVAYPVVSGGAPNDPYHLLNLDLNTFNWWMHFGVSTIWGVEGTNFFDISIPAQNAITNPSEWDSTLLNGIPVFTNGKNLLSYWAGNGGVPAASVPGWPVGTVCRAVVAFRFHIFALNIDGPSGEFTNQIMWSDAADPGALPASWTPGAGNEAGSAILADTPGACITGKPLGQQLPIYKPTSIYMVEYAGQPPDNIFVVRPALRTQGCLGPHSVLEITVDRTPCHAVIGQDDVMLFDGIGARSIAENRIKRFLANSIDETNAQNAFLIRDANKKELWVCVPEAGSQFATVAHIWDQSRDTWVTRDLNSVRYGATGFVTDSTVSDVWNADANPWDGDVSSWDQGDVAAIEHVVNAEASKIYVEDTTDLVSMTATIARYDMNFDDDNQRKVTTRVTIEGSGSDLINLQFRLGARESTDASITWGAFVPRQAGGTPYEVEGRFISIEITRTGTLDWTVSRIIIEAENTGAQ